MSNNKIIQIISGTIKNILNQEQELYEKRIVICRGCKLRKIDVIFGEMCNRSLYLNPITNETSINPKDGFIKGCGCILGSKLREKDEKCPLKKW